MNIGILSIGPKLYSTKRLKEAATERGHSARVLDTRRFSLSLEPGEPDLKYKGHPLEDIDAIIPRIGGSLAFFGTAVVRQFEQMGVFSVSASTAISVSRDKLRSMQALSRHDINIPATTFVHDRGDILPAIEKIGGVPVIIKLLEGTQGIGVILADEIKMAEAIIETLQSTRNNIILQKFVAESRGKDVRAFVVGDTVVAAMRRVAKDGGFRSNVHRGGTVESIPISPEIEHTAVLAAKILGLRVAGVDLLESNEGPMVMEVNSSPGLEGIERATGVDVAGAIIEYIDSHLRFEDIDLQHRLSLAKGYTVVEVTVTESSPLVKQTIAETGMSDMEIRVLHVNRGGHITPVPGGDFEILKGDILLCYGKQLALRGFLPAQKPQRSKKKAK